MGKKAKDQAAESTEMTKEQKAKRKMMERVAKHLRFNVPTKSAIIKGQKVEYFQGEKAVECLMESKWTKEPKDSHDSLTPYFKTRTNAIDYCIQLLQQKFFVRANKVEVKKSKLDEQTTASSSKESEPSSSLRKRGDKATDSPRAKKGDTSDSDSKKRKKKYRLEVHHQQVFADSADDVYFWQYDPVSYGTYVIGAAVVIGAVALTMQPLWPDSTRAGMWYLSMGVFVLMGVMVTLIVGRWLLFGLGLVISLGKIKFWIFPNLDNEKLGFLDSFKPFYSLEYKDASKGSKGKKKRKDKDKGIAGEKASKESENGSQKDEDQDEEEEGVKESEDTSEKMEDNEETEQMEQITS